MADRQRGVNRKVARVVSPEQGKEGENTEIKDLKS